MYENDFKEDPFGTLAETTERDENFESKLEQMKADDERARKNIPHEIQKKCDRQNDNAEAVRKQQSLEAAEYVISHSKLPRRLRNAEFKHFKVVEGNRGAIITAKEYAKKFATMEIRGMGLLLIGPVGCGKSVLAIATAKEIIRQHTRTQLPVYEVGWGHPSNPEYNIRNYLK